MLRQIHIAKQFFLLYKYFTDVTHKVDFEPRSGDLLVEKENKQPYKPRSGDLLVEKENKQPYKPRSGDLSK